MPAALPLYSPKRTESHPFCSVSWELNSPRLDHGPLEKWRDLSTLVRTAKALGTTPDQLLGLSETTADGTERSTLLDRLIVSAKGLEHSDLEAIVVQVEALLALRKFKSAKDV